MDHRVADEPAGALCDQRERRVFAEPALILLASPSPRLFTWAWRAELRYDRRVVFA
jgi:hypothetical protein